MHGTGSLDGRALAEAISAGKRALDRNRDTINSLNVFPVPDGDTGTNMTLTVQAVVAETGRAASGELAEVARVMARASLLAARGNSGLILTQFFKGLAGAASDRSALDGRAFAQALRLASDAAYQSVPDPKEGTMLTVFREAAEAAEATDATDLAEVWEAAYERATDAVRRTPEMLDVLREAGVVDAGGFGFAALLAGGLSYLKGESDGGVAVDVPPASSGTNGSSGAGAAHARAAFVERAEAESWGYCVSFAVEGDGLDPAVIRETAASIGRSCVVAGDEHNVKVHLHTMNPGEPLTYGVSLGTVSNVSVLNMDEQSREWAESQRTAPLLPIAVVAVAAGGGLTNLFVTSGLGACSVVPGGDTMNPSTGDLLAAVEAAPSQTVIVLPNNRNVVGTARQVHELTSRAVHVVPTTSVQAGIAALLAFSPDQTVETNLDAMARASESVKAVAICKAVRDSKVNGIDVKAGQVMGMVDGVVVTAGEDLETVTVELLVTCAAGAELITLYRGADASEADATRVSAAVGARLQGVEVEVVEGGQPYYPYLASVE